MPPRPPWLTRALCALVVLAAVALVAGAASATGAESSSKVPIATWAAAFCPAFAAYEKDALAAQEKTQVALAGVQNATEGATATAALGDAFTATRESAQAAATAATANGIPDVTNGKALAREIEETLVDTSTAYAKAAKRATSLPTAPRKLSAGVQKVAKQLAATLDPSSPHAKRLAELDRGNTIAKAIRSDPTCAAATNAGGTTTPATPATTAP